MFLILLFLFTIVPALELYLLFKIGGMIGGWNTVLIVLLTGMLGASLARSQGLQILAKLQNEMQSGQLPARSLQRAFLVFAGGLLLLTPGFFTDALGLSFIFPVTQYFWCLFIEKLFQQGIQNGNVRVVQFGSFGAGNPFEHGPQGPVYTPPPGARRSALDDGDVIDVDFSKE